MIQTEFYRTREDGVGLYRTYSDEGMKIQCSDGGLYDECVNVLNAPYTYTETIIPIPREAVDIDEDTMENAMRFMMGDGLITTPSEPEPDYFNEREPEPNYFNEEE